MLSFGSAAWVGTINVTEIASALAAAMVRFMSRLWLQAVDFA
jgi:hypothetical protein